jgi:hypothetical protein
MKTETVTQYAPFIQHRSGKWCKIQPFTSRSKEEAERYIKQSKSSNPYMGNAKFKIMRRTVTITATEWEDV